MVSKAPFKQPEAQQRCIIATTKCPYKKKNGSPESVHVAVNRHFTCWKELTFIF